LKEKKTALKEGRIAWRSIIPTGSGEGTNAWIVVKSGSIANNVALIVV
jgi:hypothetical protein